MPRFRGFLINEEAAYFGRRVGDVLTAMQDVQDDLPNLGARHLTNLAEELVNQIRKILHGSWSAKAQPHLKDLQRVAVAIKRTIEEKGDLREVLPAAMQAVQDLSGKLGVRVNKLDAPDAVPGTQARPEDFQLTGAGPQEQPSAPPPQAQPQI